MIDAGGGPGVPHSAVPQPLRLSGRRLRPGSAARMRAQAERYGAAIVAGQVDGLERLDDGQFRASCGGRSLTAKRALLATGAFDIEPQLPGHRERHPARPRPALPDLRRLRGHRPEGRADRIRQMPGAEAMLLRGYTADLTILTLGRGLEDRARGGARPGAGRHPRGGRARRTAPDGRGPDRILAHAKRQEARVPVPLHRARVADALDLATALGASADEDGALPRRCAPAAPRFPVSTRAGNVVQGLSQISVAMGHAAIAATDINVSLGLPAPDPARGARSRNATHRPSPARVRDTGPPVRHRGRRC